MGRVAWGEGCERRREGQLKSEMGQDEQHGRSAGSKYGRGKRNSLVEPSQGNDSTSMFATAQVVSNDLSQGPPPISPREAAEVGKLGRTSVPEIWSLGLSPRLASERLMPISLVPIVSLVAFQ